MSARYKYIVAAVAGVALLGGAAAVTYYTNTQSAPASAAFEDGEADAADNTVDLAATEDTADATVDGSVEAGSLEEVSAAPVIVAETGETADTVVSPVAPVDIVIETAPAAEPAAAPAVSENQPE